MMPDELARRMSPRQLAEYHALLFIEPWGDYRLDALVAHALYHLVGCWTDSKNLKPKDFIPRWGKGKKGKLNRNSPKVHAKARKQLLDFVEAFKVAKAAESKE